MPALGRPFLGSLLVLLAWIGPPLQLGGQERAWTKALPLMEASYSLPPLPATSLRNANYTIEARLDPERHTIEGNLVLEWRNTTEAPQSSFPFHLYWNAFRNNRSTLSREEGRRSMPAQSFQGEAGRELGWIQVHSVKLLDPEADLTPTLRYIHPDDDNAEDRTVMEVSTPSPVLPGDTVRFRIDWTSKIPYGSYGRAGWVHDYNFIAQWFPKIGVFWKGAWNCHQFHASSEFFSDYGVYDVKLTLPRGFVVGATGQAKEQVDNPDGTQVVRFHQEDVHDFAWTASRRFVERMGRFEAAGYPSVSIRLLIQPEHAHLAARYIEATKICLRSYGAWSAPYPYSQITVVDPAWNSASGGMEYPTLFTGGANVFAPQVLQSPESVTVHECGHQFWYGLVGNNEFEEAWLDEGINSYHTSKATNLALGPRGWGRRYFVLPGRRSRGGWPVVAPDVWVSRGTSELSNLRAFGTSDVMVRRAWEYRSLDGYALNAYGKPSLTLYTLEGLLGDEMMTRVLRTYSRRFRFAHPTTEDFIATVNEVTGKNYRWYFDQTWFSSDLCDYAVSVSNKLAGPLEGYTESNSGQPVLAKRAPRSSTYDSEVTLLRLGGVRMPVELLVEFSDGRTRTETWDGQYRWTRFRYPGAKVKRAVVDPEGKIAIDVNPANNSWVDEEGVSRRAAIKWSTRWMLWLQNLLELHALLG